MGIEGFPEQFGRNVGDAASQAENIKNKEDAASKSYENMRRIIEEMKNDSPYKRERISSSREKISSPELGEYFINHVTDPKDPRVNKIGEFMDIFEPGEFDVEEIAKNVSYDCYGYFVLEDPEGNIVGVLQSSYVEGNLSEESYSEFWNDSRMEKGLLFMGYIVVDEDLRKRGLSLELNQSAFDFGNERAKKLNQSLDTIVVEAANDVVEYQANKIGLRRLYYEDKNGNYHELPYLQPPLVWNKETARPLNPETEEEDGGDVWDHSVQEHLMLRRIDEKNEMRIEDILAVVASLYEDNYEGKEFPGDSETPAIVGELKKLTTELKKRMEESKDKTVKMLTRQEREDLKKKGITFYEQEKAKEAPNGNDS